MVMAAGTAVVLSTFLGRTLMEQFRTTNHAALERASWRARGQLELAKHVIKNSPYTAGENDVVAASLAAVPPLISGTSVVIEAVGPNRWYRLTAICEYGGQIGSAMAFMRDGTSYVVYNYYVENDDLGVSGQPRGRVHSNRKVEFHFEGGRYDSLVTAGEGFEFKAGATEDNTRFDGGRDPAASPKTLLEDIDYEQLESDASFVAPVGLDAKVEFQNDQTIIQMFSKPTIISVPTTTTEDVQVGSEYQEVTRTTYRIEYEWVEVEKTRKVWVADSTSATPTGTATGGTVEESGHWETEYYTELEYVAVEVEDGTEISWEWVPVYDTVTTTETMTSDVEGTLVSLTIVPSAGILYFPDDVVAVSGDLDGRVTLVTEGGATITDHIRYVDASGETAFLHGTDPDQEFQPNPQFERQHSLGIIAADDIRYARTVPTRLEINGTLVSTGGMVGFEGIDVDEFGQPYRVGDPVTAESLRRYGSLMSYQRPVAALIDSEGNIEHGFLSGDSLYDRNLIGSPPPGFPDEEKILFLPDIRVDYSNVTDAGAGMWGPSLTPIANPMTPQDLFNLIGPANYDWGTTDHDSVFTGTGKVQITDTDSTFTLSTKVGDSIESSTPVSAPMTLPSS
jgi:hypothetical protein